MNNKILKILLNLQNKYGKAIFLPVNRKQLKALLLDFTKNKCRREVYLVLESLELGVLKELSRYTNMVRQQNVCFRKLTYDYCMSEEGARYVIDLWSSLLLAKPKAHSGQNVNLRRAN